MGYISFCHATLFVCLLLQFSSISSTNALNGFSTKFIHRDSPESPFYDPSISQKERADRAIERSMSRVSRFKSAPNFRTNVDVKRRTGDINATIIPGDGDYLMEFYVGTPPFKQVAVADTGSDVTWTQCLPCENCYKQNQPIFNSGKSSTFRPLTCGSNLCDALGGSCSGTTGTCEYQLGYVDGSSSFGVLALDTYTLGGTSIPNLVYGCSHYSQSSFGPDAAGIVGLGGGPLSLVGQLRKSISGKFSYCLSSDHTPGASNEINFGSNAIVSGPGVVSTPLITTSTYYCLTLESISVGGNTKIFFNGISKSGKPIPVEEGNIIIDSGTTLTLLPPGMHQNLEKTMKNSIKADPISDPKHFFGLCYKVNKSFNAPTITAHFSGGADLVLPWTSTFYMYDDSDVGCLAFRPNDDLAIYGNLSQMDFLIGYDLENKTVSFKPTNCAQINK